MPGDYLRQVKRVAEAVTILNDFKVTRGCADCGFNRWPEALQFDHVDPQTKLRSLGWVRDRSKLTSRNKIVRYLEHVSKYCQVRCANCHAHRTMVEGHWRPRDEQPFQADDMLF